MDEYNTAQENKPRVVSSQPVVIAAGIAGNNKTESMLCVILNVVEGILPDNIQEFLTTASGDAELSSEQAALYWNSQGSMNQQLIGGLLENKIKTVEQIATEMVRAEGIAMSDTKARIQEKYEHLKGCDAHWTQQREDDTIMSEMMLRSCWVTRRGEHPGDQIIHCRMWGSIETPTLITVESLTAGQAQMWLSRVMTAYTSMIRECERRGFWEIVIPISDIMVAVAVHTDMEMWLYDEIYRLASLHACIDPRRVFVVFETQEGAKKCDVSWSTRKDTTKMVR